MNKKIMAIAIAILLSSTGVATIALAQQGEVYTGEVETVPEIWPIPEPRYPKVTVVYGVGLDKDSMETEPVVFLEIKYNGATETVIQILPGDVDRDCDVDSDDFDLLLASYGKSEGDPGYNSNADFNHDGKVDFEDAMILLKNYGKKCPTPIPPIPATKYYLIVDGDIYRMTKTYERYDSDTRTKIYKFEANDGSIMTAIVQYYSNGIRSISAEFKNYLMTFEPIHQLIPRTATAKALPYPGLMGEISEELGIDIKNVQSGQTAEWLE